MGTSNSVAGEDERVPSHLPVHESDEVRIHRVARRSRDCNLVQARRFLVKSKLLADERGRPRVGVFKRMDADRVYFVSRPSQRMLQDDALQQANNAFKLEDGP